MDNDNIYPSGSYYQPTEPREQANDREKAIKETFDAIPLLKETIERLDERIAFYESISAVPDEVLANPEEFMHTVAANKLTVENLKAERGYIQERVEEATS